MLLRPGTEIDGGQNALHGSAVEALRHRAVGGDEGYGDAARPHEVPEAGQIGPVVAVGAVLVLHLHQDHRAALVDLEGGQDGEQRPIVVLHVGQEGRAGAPELYSILRQQPGRQSPQVPLRTDVGGGAEDHI